VKLRRGFLSYKSCSFCNFHRSEPRTIVSHTLITNFSSDPIRTLSKWRDGEIELGTIIRRRKKMAIGIHYPKFLAHAHQNVQKCSKTLNPAYIFSIAHDQILQKMWRPFYFYRPRKTLTTLKLAWYCGKMYSRDFFPYWGLKKMLHRGPLVS